MAKNCKTCNGTGQLNSKDCPNCHGLGEEILESDLENFELDREDLDDDDDFDGELVEP
jgi:DnaJ-class molecular chaperone